LTPIFFAHVLKTSPGFPDWKHFFSLAQKDSPEKHLGISLERKYLFILTNVSQIDEDLLPLTLNSFKLARSPGSSRIAA
jgi:hypothetical protein